MSNEDVLSRTRQTNPRPIAREENIGTAAAKDPVAIGMHFTEIFSSMQATDLPIVFCFLLLRSDIVSIDLVLGREDRLDLAHLKPIFGDSRSLRVRCPSSNRGGLVGGKNSWSSSMRPVCRRMVA